MDCKTPLYNSLTLSRNTLYIGLCTATASIITHKELGISTQFSRLIIDFLNITGNLCGGRLVPSFGYIRYLAKKAVALRQCTVYTSACRSASVSSLLVASGSSLCGIPCRSVGRRLYHCVCVNNYCSWLHVKWRLVFSVFYNFNSYNCLDFKRRLRLQLKELTVTVSMLHVWMSISIFSRILFQNTVIIAE